MIKKNNFYKLIRAIFVLMISTALLVSMCGCNDDNPSSNSGSSPTGALMLYNESEIGSKAGLKNPENLRIDSKGNLLIYENEGQSGNFISLNAEGELQSKISCNLKGYFVSFDLDAQDNIYAVMMESGSAGMSQKVYIVNPSGKIENTLPLEKLNNGAGIMPYVRDIAVGENGKIYVATLDGIYVLDKSGKLDKKIGKGSYYSIDTDKDSNLITYGIQDGKFSLAEIDSGTGKNIWSNEDIKKLKSIDVDSYKARYNPFKKCIFMMDSYSITGFDDEGKLLEKVFDLKQYTVLTSGNSLAAMNIDQKGNVYILTKGSGSSELYKYDIQAGTHKVKERKVITLAVPVAERWLEVAALKYQKVNPDYRVEIKQYEDNPDQNNNYDNYVKVLNTELLTGKGPDIINTSGVPYEKYAEKNLLADLGQMMEEDKEFNREDYYTNLFDALKYKDKLYSLPASVKFSVLAASKKILENETISVDDSKWTWEDLIKIGGGLSKDRKMFVSMTMKSLLDYMLKGNYTSFINESEKKASFDSQEFTSLLEFVKKYGDSTIPAGMIETNANLGDVESIQKGRVVFNPFDINSYINYALLNGIYDNQVKLLRFPSAGNDKGTVFDSSAIFSINNTSKNKAAAWEFLKYLLSDEIQSGEISGLAVNKKALEDTAKKAITMTESGGMSFAVSSKDGKAPIIIEPKPLTQENIDYINSFIENMSAYNKNNSGVNSIISTETLPFFSGHMTAQEAARIIQDKVNIYLGE